MGCYVYVTNMSYVHRPSSDSCYYLYSTLDHGYPVREIHFQEGRQDGEGINGFQVDEVLSVCMDRLDIFEGTDEFDDTVKEALAYISKARDILQKKGRWEF
jgi:hypothetical protein